MAIYLGTHFSGCTTSVVVNDRPLCPRHDLARHADHLNWQRPGGSLQLSLAILAHHCGGDEQRALDHYQAFCELVVDHLPGEIWMLDAGEIEAALEGLESSCAEIAA